MNVFLHELRSYRKSTLIWAISLAVGSAVFLLMFPAFTKDIEASQKVLENFPPALRAALGFSLKDFFTVYGFFSYLFTFMSLGGAVQGMNLGVSIISKEENGKTVDFLLTKPISRAKIITSKLLAAFCCLLLTNVVFSFAALTMAKIVSTGDFSPKTFLLISSTMFFIQLFFLALGTLFSVALLKIKSVIAVSLPTVFTFFIVGTLGAIVGNDNVRYLSPFKFYDSAYIINHTSYETKFLMLELIFILATITASYILYINKDIRATS